MWLPAFTPTECGVYVDQQQEVKVSVSISLSLCLSLAPLSGYRQVFFFFFLLPSVVFLFLLFLRHHPKNLLLLLPPHPPHPHPASTLCWVRDRDEGGNGRFWLTKVLRCNLVQAEMWSVCSWLHVCVKRGKGPGRCVMLGLLHRKLICLYFIPHFGSDEPAPHSSCGWPSFATLCDSLSLSLSLTI